MNFWVFIGLVVAASIPGTFLFGPVGFVIIVGKAFIIYLPANRATY